MIELFSLFLSRTFLRSVWELEYIAFRDTDEERALEERLHRWSERRDLREISAEAAFIEEFFRQTWGYEQAGQLGAETGRFTLFPNFQIGGAGEGGGTGEADLAIGYFRNDDQPSIPQVLCEFKDIRNNRELENSFYAEYRNFREKLYLGLLKDNGPGTERFPGTKGRLVRLAQKILDWCIFIFFCEDMGHTLAFPPKLFQDLLIECSKDRYFDAGETDIWQIVLRLFRAMNEGRAFDGKPINRFNGGLFDYDEVLERVHVPDAVFCQHMQGSNEASLYSYKETLLYLCESYNYASDIGRANKRSASARNPAKSLGLYTLGGIFEQSITELEILEAEADGRPSVNKLSKRKRDGVYYTPELVVQRIVDETLGPRLAEIKRECDWPTRGTPTIDAINDYAARLKEFTVLDPACGSGAFLITALRYLLDEWHQVEAVRRRVEGSPAASDEDAKLISDILKDNLYGDDVTRLRSRSHSLRSGCIRRGETIRCRRLAIISGRKQPGRTRILQGSNRASLQQCRTRAGECVRLVANLSAGLQARRL